MPTLTITAKGQITLRKDLLRHLGARPGDKVSVDPLPGGGIALRVARRDGRISDIFNILKRDGGPTLSIDDMNQQIAQAWAGER